MATYVLIPGAWLGGWCWNRVAPVLRAAGHRIANSEIGRAKMAGSVGSSKEGTTRC